MKTHSLVDRANFTFGFTSPTYLSFFVAQGISVSWLIRANVSSLSHCGLKVSSSHEKIAENFANNFLKTIANNKCLIMLKCTC